MPDGRRLKLGLILGVLAASGLALGAALTIAGPVIRVVLGLLELLLGLSVLLGGFLAISDPARAGAAAVTAATGISGQASIALALVDPTVTGWPFVALFSGLLMALVGVGIVVTAGRWPGPTTRYQSVRLEPLRPVGADVAGQAAPRDAVDDWDELSRGDDPTTGQSR